MEAAVIGFIFCVLPVFIVGGAVYAAVRASRPKVDETRMGDLEAQVVWLSRHNTALEQRVARLEQVLADAWDDEDEDEHEDEAAEAREAETDHRAPRAPSRVSPQRPPPTDDDAETIAPAPAGGAEPPPGRDAEAARDTEPDADAEPDAEPLPDAAPGASPEAMPDQLAARWGHDPSAGPPPVTAAAPDPTAAPPAAPSPEAPPPKRAIEWEQWIGVRGAAALGASLLVLAGIYFFEYSIEHGLITPAMRMVAGTLIGLVCVGASELRLRRTHAVLANWLAGAGIGILYVAFWAGRVLYELYPTWAAGILLAAVTAACVTLATRRSSAAIAVLGLFGGFVTPLALSTGSDRPIPLFSYLLLLDGAMLWVAYRKRWSWMAAVCLAGTAVYEAMWLFGRLDAGRLLLGVAIVAVFGGLFAAMPRAAQRSDDPGEAEEPLVFKLTRAVGVLLPFLFTMGLAVRQDLGPHAYVATSLLLVALSVGAFAVGLRHRNMLLPLGAALGATGTLFGWGVAHWPDSTLGVWQLVGLCVALLLVFLGGGELARRRDEPLGPAPVAAYGGATLSMAFLASAFADAAGPWPWFLLYAVTLAAGARACRRGRWAAIQPAYAGLAALGLGTMFAVQAGRTDSGVLLGVLGLFAALVLGIALLARHPEARRFGEHAAAAFAVCLIPLLSFVHDTYVVPPWAFFAATGVLGLIALLASARRGTALWMTVALLAVALAQSVWVARRSETLGGWELIGMAAAVLLFATFPVVAPRPLREQAWAWRTAALVGPCWLLALRHTYLEVLGPSTIGLLPIALAAISVAGAYGVRVRGPEVAHARRTALVWLTAAAAGFVTLAIPMQLDNEWWTIGWALEGLAMTVLWRRLDHSGLKYLGVGLAAAVCVRLIGNPYVLDYGARGSLPILNWLTYTYIVPAASLVAMWALLRSPEIERRRPWERSLMGERHAFLANACAAAAIAVVFVWVNLTIFDLFGTGRELTIPTDRLPARDLTLSIAWAVYAVGLLVLGMWRESMSLRVTSLALILVTCGKVFLYDLAHLSDLYRVASLVGLALSLIFISLVYQRFVFRRGAKEGS